MKKYIYYLFVILAIATPTLAMDEDFLITLQGRIYNDEKIISINRWSTEYGNLVCIYSRPSTYIWGSDIEKENLQHFVIYMQKKGSLIVVYKEDIYNIILGVMQENDKLLNLIVPGGSVYGMKTYSFDGHKVKMIREGIL
jgi:hypothetical protein